MGLKVERPACFIKDGLAVARPIGEERMWMVGHVPTGTSCGGIRYRRQSDAKAALLEMLPLVGWSGIVNPDMRVYGPKLFNQIKEIAARHNGLNLFGSPVQP